MVRIRLSLADQRLKVDAAQLSLDEEGQKLIDEVRQSYYQVLQSQIQYASQQSTVKYLEELLRLTDRRVGQQTALKADSLTVKAEVAKAMYQLAMTEDGLANHKEALNHLLGRSVQTEFSVELVAASLPEREDVAAAAETALEHRPDVKLAANRMRQAELATRSEKTHYIPDVSIQASYLSPRNIDFLPQNVASVGALLTWQPWDWGAKRRRVQQAAIAEKQAGLSFEDTREQILLEVHANFRRLREARARLAATEAVRDAEAEKMRNQKEAYLQESIVLSDLLKQTSSLVEAEGQWNQAVLAYWSAWADFQKTLGKE